jgi:uncharacterized protein|tara:strand:+ start:427 stop:600 length:174 start_codon:yes stop_codon:yes gene_type:complete
MINLILTFLVLLLVILGMSLGVIFGRKPISGSCGGLQGLDPDRECELCGGNVSKCPN